MITTSIVKVVSQRTTPRRTADNAAQQLHQILNPMHNLTVLAFDNPVQGFQLRDALPKLNDESLIEMIDAVVVTRDAAGKVELHQSQGIAPMASGAAVGSIAGFIIGLIFTLPGAGSVVGAGIGTAIGALKDFGVNDQFVKDLGETLTPGTSALAVLSSKGRFEEIQARIGPLFKGAKLLQSTVDPEREAEFRRVLLNQ